jgi:hypothetical protein
MRDRVREQESWKDRKLGVVVCMWRDPKMSDVLQGLMCGWGGEEEKVLALRKLNNCDAEVMNRLSLRT